MANLNKIVLIGNVTADPDMRFTVEGTAITKYRVAVNRPQRSDGGEAGTDFISVVSFGRLAEVSGEYLKKGRMIMVEGRIQVRSYTTADGQTKWATEVVASSMNLLDKNKTEERSYAEEQAPEGAVPEEGSEGEGMYDDIPF